MDEIFGIASLIVTMWQYLPYCYKIYRRELRPHVFSFIIWGIGAAVVAVAQWSENAGPGAWAMAMTAFFCVVVVLLSLRGGTGYVTRGDWITFAAALSAIPLWILTQHALTAVVIITLIDVSAFYITFRKVLKQPHEESAGFYGIALLQYVLSVLAISSYNLTTVLNPAVLIATTIVLIGAMIHLQKQTPKPTAST